MALVQLCPSSPVAAAIPACLHVRVCSASASRGGRAVSPSRECSSRAGVWAGVAVAAVAATASRGGKAPHCRRAHAAVSSAPGSKRRRGRGGLATAASTLVYEVGPPTALKQAPQAQGDYLSGPLELGRWTLKSRLLLAPLECVSDCAYRRMCSELGAGFTWTEMVRPQSVVRRNNSTLSRIDTHDAETPTGVQLLGASLESISGALEVLDELAATTHPHWARGIHGLDLNLACPSTNVIKGGHGPALLNKVDRLEELFELLARWRARTQLPVGAIGAKLRLGLNADEERRGVFLRAVRLAKGRLDYVSVHARHAREDSKSSRARWEQIRAAKDVAGDALKVIGNGDVFTRADAVEMLRSTGCDGVLAARGAIRSAGMIFDPGWQGDDDSVASAADRLERQYAEHSERFGGPRQKNLEYHREAFRRVRARGRRTGPRVVWRRLAKWLQTKGRGDVALDFGGASTRQRLAQFFCARGQNQFLQLAAFGGEGVRWSRWGSAFRTLPCEGLSAERR